MWITWPPETQVPIACGGAAVFPGDVLFGDEDGVVVFPADLAAELAADGAKQERLETFLQSRQVLDGAPIAGTYPPGRGNVGGLREMGQSELTQ